MKISLPKFNKEKKLKLSALHQPLFNTDFYWYLVLVFFAVVLIIMGVVGFRLFSYGYFESYRKEASEEMFKDVVNVDKLRNIIDSRKARIETSNIFPLDPA